MRLLRLARLIRLFRLLKELWLLVVSVLISFRTLFWAVPVEGPCCTGVRAAVSNELSEGVD